MVKGPNGETDVVVSAADRRRLGERLGGQRQHQHQRALLASGVIVAMSLEKEIGSESPLEAFTAASAHLSDAVSGGGLIEQIKAVASAGGQPSNTYASVDVDKDAFVAPAAFSASHCDGNEVVIPSVKN